MIPQVTCYNDTDLIHAAYAVAGLIEAADAGEIDLQFRRSDPKLRRPEGHWALWMRIKGEEGDFGACVDCHDVADYFCPDSLAACRFYYKSNLSEKTYRAVPPEYREKLRPLGPYLPSRPRHDRAVRSRWIGSAFTKIRQRLLWSTRRLSFTNNLREIYWDLVRGKRYLSRKTWDQYENAPINAEAGQRVILFNPACWDESEGDEVCQLNEFRARLIVALREAFGERFVGGFRRYGPSYHKYPDACETSYISHDEYVRLLGSSNLAVYTNGKWDCFSWRLAETLAASKCIVSQRIPNDAGVPLDERVGIVQCDTIEEMVAALKRFDKDPELTREYAERCQRYYEEWVRPRERMRKLIAEVLAPASDCARTLTIG